MHFAILTQYYPPEIGAPQARLSELAAHFLQRGHTVTVLTAMPNYPTGKIYAGYGGWLSREQRKGVEVIRTFIYPTQKADLVRRLTNYFSFVVSSASLGAVALPRPDYLMVESPPLFLGIAGLWLSRLKRARLIFNVSDLWPESAVRLGMLREDSVAYRLSAWLEGLCYRRAWLVSGQSRSTVASIAGRFPSSRTFHLSNGVDTTRFRADCVTEAARRTLGGSEGLIVFYAGLHGLAQGLEQVIRTAGVLQGEPDFQFVLMGDGPEKGQLVRQAREQHVTNVRFLDPRPADEIPAYLAAADVVLISLKTDIPGAVPSKLYEAMASGRPVVLVAQGEAAAIVNEHQAGVAVDPGNVEGIARALRTLRADAGLRQRLGENGRRAAERYFDRTKIASGFIDYLESQMPSAALMGLPTPQSPSSITRPFASTRGSSGNDA